MYDVAVVGAGPAGAAATFFLSNRGYKVLTIERNPHPGTICGEYVPDPSSLRIRSDLGSEYFEFVSPFIVHKLRSIRIELLGRTFRTPYVGYSIRRRDLLRERLEQAEGEGARVLLKESFISLKREGSLYRILTNRGMYTARYIIGADGFPSRISSMMGEDEIDCDDVSIAFPFEVDLNIDDPDEVKLFFDEGVAPGAYAWIIPRGNSRANVGLGVRMSMYNASEALRYVREFLSRIGVSLNPRGDLRGRFVPVGGIVRTLASDGIFLLGDSAGMVIPSNGGGIHTAVISAYLLSISLESDSPEREYVLSINKHVKPLVDDGLTYRRAADALMRLGILRRIVNLIPESIVAEAITGNRGSYHGILKLASYLYRSPPRRPFYPCTALRTRKFPHEQA
ncbi:MAG: NAD(P)/FAD-dependent oxidoreductase [Candidatus Korarchaeum sp.]